MPDFMAMKATKLAVEVLLALSMASAFHPTARAVLPRMGWSRARSPALPGARLRISDVAPASAAVLWTWDELRERSGPVPDRVVIGDTIGGTQGLPGGLTLFRDRNGWCPYSERVWLAHILKSDLFATPCRNYARALAFKDFYCTCRRCLPRASTSTKS